jgi:integrase/recombinase XerC
MDFVRLHEIPRYLDACEQWYRLLAEVLIACGLRISEALALNWAHVDLNGRRLLILSSRKRGADGDVRGSTKGDRFRGVEFGPRIAQILRDLQSEQAASGQTGPAQPVFRGPRGTRLARNDVSRGAHKRALRDAGLRTSLRLHDLRHTAAASWLAAGLPLIYVQRQLGHASITTTESAYGHLEESFLRGAPERAEAFIWNAAASADE